MTAKFASFDNGTLARRSYSIYPLLQLSGLPYQRKPFRSCNGQSVAVSAKFVHASGSRTLEGNYRKWEWRMGREMIESKT